jgi:hypothetical protein
MAVVRLNSVTILRLFNLDTATSPAFYVVSLGRFLYQRKNNFYSKKRHAIGCAVSFYNAGVVIQGRRIGSKSQSYSYDLIHSCNASVVVG